MISVACGGAAELPSPYIMSTTKQISKLGSLSTCDISDALIKLGVVSGGYITGLNLFSTGKICAPAYTVQMVLASDTSAPKLSEHFVDTAPAGSVIVIDVPQRNFPAFCPTDF
jgi:regulator of RNase E activity RraA